MAKVSKSPKLHRPPSDLNLLKPPSQDGDDPNPNPDEPNTTAPANTNANAKLHPNHKHSTHSGKHNHKNQIQAFHTLSQQFKDTEPQHPPQDDHHSQTSAGPLSTARKIPKDLWRICCNEIAFEREEYNKILESLDLPSLNSSKDKIFPLHDYDFAPDMESCKGKDYLDFYVFPILLPGIMGLIQRAKELRVFESKVNGFNAMDYIVEYLHNNNPRYPDRLEFPVPLEEIPFVQDWWKLYPRPHLPKWLTMTKEDATRIIQRCYRGYLVRKRPDVQEMIEFWKDLKKDHYDGAHFSTLVEWRKHVDQLHAIVTIQSHVRGYNVRKAGKVHEMRRRWSLVKHEKEKEMIDRHSLTLKVLLTKKDGTGSSLNEGQGQGQGMEEEEASSQAKASVFFQGEISESERAILDDEETEFQTHSETCLLCAKFREILDQLEAKEREKALKEAQEKGHGRSGSGSKGQKKSSRQSGERKGSEEGKEKEQEQKEKKSQS